MILAVYRTSKKTVMCISVIHSLTSFSHHITDQKAQTQPMSSQADTHLLIAATSFGKGIKRRMDSPGQPQRPPSTGQPGQPHQPPPGSLPIQPTISSHILMLLFYRNVHSTYQC